MTEILIFIFLISLCLGLSIIPQAVKLSKELHFYDLPDSRKVHKLPIPRIGGVVFLPVSILSVALVLSIALNFGSITFIFNELNIQHFLAYLCGAIILFSIGLYDDIRGVGYKAKLFLQILTGVILCVGGLWISDFYGTFCIDALPCWMGIPMTIFFIVYITNAMNLIDGIEGLASGIACITFAILALYCHLGNDMVWVMLAVAFIGSTISFVYYNVFGKQNKIFMGDAGSLTLGYTLSFLILQVWNKDCTSCFDTGNAVIITMSSLTIPLLDVIRVFVHRIRNGKNPFMPDKNHIHHKLLNKGLSKNVTTTTLLIADLTIVAINYFTVDYLPKSVIVGINVALFVILCYIIKLIHITNPKSHI